MDATAHAPTDPKRKLRIAMGVFDRIEALERALDGLAKTGVERSHLVIVAGDGRPDTLAGTILRDGGWPANRGIRVQGRHGTALKIDGASQSAFAAPGLLSAPFETWGTARSTEKLNAYLDRGACVLVALIDAIEHEREVIEVLLASSIDQVQQHDVSSPTLV